MLIMFTITINFGSKYKKHNTNLVYTNTIRVDKVKSFFYTIKILILQLYTKNHIEHQNITKIYKEYIVCLQIMKYYMGNTMGKEKG